MLIGRLCSHVAQHSVWVIQDDGKAARLNRLFWATLAVVARVAMFKLRALFPVKSCGESFKAPCGVLLHGGLLQFPPEQFSGNAHSADTRLAIQMCVLCVLQASIRFQSAWLKEGAFTLRTTTGHSPDPTAASHTPCYPSITLSYCPAWSHERYSLSVFGQAFACQQRTPRDVL